MVSCKKSLGSVHTYIIKIIYVCTLLFKILGSESYLFYFFIKEINTCIQEGHINWQ